MLNDYGSCDNELMEIIYDYIYEHIYPLDAYRFWVYA